MHPIHRRYYAEDLVRLRRAASLRRRVAAQRRSRVDANPHQIEAVMFALRRIPEGGCILADEVGLGKTIEAGLVIAQLLAEGKERILILLPRPLLGQWSDELRDLFGIDAVEASDPGIDLGAPGVVLAGREYAGGERGFERLRQAAPFDLCLIDEAHEVFAGLHRRFRSDGSYDEDSPHARTAHRARQIIGVSPVLLLTATPIQNSLSEMWSLVQYIDRTGTLLGDKPTFDELFDGGSGGRSISQSQANELQRRLGLVVQRTLRRQAVEYLERPFVGRQARLFRYRMRPDEKTLYDDVTEYLLRPRLLAFRGRARQLQLIGFHRRMASSTAALARSLEGVAKRLRGLLRSEPADDGAADLADLEESDEPGTSIVNDNTADTPAPMTGATPPSAAVEKELAEINDFVERARALPEDSKAESLLKAVELVMDRPRDRRKLLIFTESLTTQEFLRDLLVERTELREADITLFRGVNDSPRAAEALRIWREEVESEFPEYRRPSPSVAVRLALVHEFRHRSTVMIASEAGAKGLNLQFCDTVVNYDLPWNPQRIEQRIGRCHRYGQKRDVTVINFLAEDNEAQRLTFDILSSKLDLFGKVLDMSDVVLQTPRSDASETLASALGPDFESQLRRIWERARSVEEVEAELRRLGDALEDRRRELERVRERAIGLIERRLDASVREVFDEIRSGLGPALTELDRDLERVLTAYLEGAGAVQGAGESGGGRRVLHFGASDRLPPGFRSGGSVVVGDARGISAVDPLHLGHPLIRAAVDDARRRGSGAFRVAFRLGPSAPASLRDRRGSRGRLALTRVRYAGFEDEERLRATVVFEDAEVLRPGEAALALLRQPCVDSEALSPPLAVGEADLDEVVEEELFEEHGRFAAVNQQSFEQSMSQLDQYLEDRMLVLRRDRQRAAERLAAAERERDRSMGADRRARAEARVRRAEREVERLDGRIAELVAREDATYDHWKTDAKERRYAPPSATRLLSAEFVIE